MPNNNKIIIKCNTKRHEPNEDIKGIQYFDPIDKEFQHSILGVELLDYEKVDSIPENFKPIGEDFFLLHDAQSVNCVYGPRAEENAKHSVVSEAIYHAMDEDGWDENIDVEYVEFTTDAFSKFCFLFKKENRMFYLTY